MATILPAAPALSGDLSLFHTTDPLLSNSPVLVFYGPAATIGATSSRIQIHVFTPGGIGSYARLSVSPNSPFYSAVSNLPREEQGDEVCRGLAFGLKKYFEELSPEVKKAWAKHSKAPSLFGDDHIAILATRMVRIQNVEEVVADLGEAFYEQRLSWLDVDVVLPNGSVKEVGDVGEEVNEEEVLRRQYGRYAELVATLGERSFLPTSKLKRAPSKATAIGRSASFLRHQKEMVRDQLFELLSTEENYVGRLEELQSFSESVGMDLKERHQQHLSEIFSPTIKKILELNSGFLDDLQEWIKSTEEAAAEDIEKTMDVEDSRSRAISSPDACGLGSIAQCLCDWLPKFADCYKEYMSTHARSSQTLRKLLRNGDSLSAELQEIGEQKLTSLLIEPVQRLPRYNLYIDSIAKQLPVRHPALTALLKARDIVTEICAESEGPGATQTIDRLQSRTTNWPADISITGRLVTVVDYIELAPPHRLDSTDGVRGIYLLFTDGIIVVEKAPKSKTTARTLLTEIESGSLPAKSVESLAETAGDLQFVRRLHLDAVQCTESHDGQALQMLTFFQLSMAAVPAQEPILDSCQVVRLENAYEGKAARFVEEFSKARVEGRFSEGERESHSWEFRATNPGSDSLGLFTAVFEDSKVENVSARGAPAQVRIIVDIDRHSSPPRAGQNGIRTVIALSPQRGGDWRVTVDSVDGSGGREHHETPDVVAAVQRKIVTLTGQRLAIGQSATAACLLERNADVLHSIDVQAVVQEDDQKTPHLAPRERYRRPTSPKKLLSSFLSSVGPGAEPPTLLQKGLPGLPASSLSSRNSTFIPPQPPSRESRPSSKEQNSSFTNTSFSSVSSEQPPSPVKKLEETLSAYILALHARKGNIVGKNLKMRVVADELMVSELYNSLLEDPNMMVLAAQAPLDVLFAAFEKFLNRVWIEHVGQVIPIAVLHDIQSKAETMFPADFDHYFRTAMGKLAPQNQRAFKAIMKLLAELLDGTGNDGDRGILTAAFAEVLVTDGNPHEYIALIDRFVDDTDTYFGEPVEEHTHHKHDTGSLNSHKRTRSANSASLTSNTSSLRRKFGFGTLSRENSKSEESKVASVWRTLSKSTRGDVSPGGSLSKASLGRSRSIDTDARPKSQEGQKGFGMMSTNNLMTIGEHPSFIPTGPPKKKRRSSLSDLKVLNGALSREPSAPNTPHRPALAPSAIEDKAIATPVISSSTPSPVRGSYSRFGTPQQSTPRSRLPSSFRRDLSPAPSKALGEQQHRPKTTGDNPDDVVITARPTSNIPSLMPKPNGIPKPSPRSGLSERPGAGNIVKQPSPQPEKKAAYTRRMTNPDLSASPVIPARKLRMQSPQKLRERLQTEQKSIAAVQESLQDELSNIGNELTASAAAAASSTSTSTSPLRPTTSRANKTFAGRGTLPHLSSNSTTSLNTMDLTQRVLKLEALLSTQTASANDRISALQADLQTSLSVSETKCKKLDELYREANGENEALYARFNEELGRVLKVVRGGEGVEELRRQLKAVQEEAGMLKRETMRLKRENVGLRAQLRE